MTRLVATAATLCALAAGLGAAPAARIGKLKTLYPRTVLVRNGAPRSVIVIPEGEAWTALAERLQGALRQSTSATAPLRRDTDIVKDWRLRKDAFAHDTLVALGNVNNNALLAWLYGEGYAMADSLYPGPGGHVVRTVHDPFAKGVNVLVLAGSDAAGVKTAVDVFLAKYAKPKGRDLVLPAPIVVTRIVFSSQPFHHDPSKSPLGSKRMPQYRTLAWFRKAWTKAGFMDEAGRVIAHKDPKLTRTRLLTTLMQMGETWYRTGDPALPPLMKQLLDKNRRLLTNPDRVRGMSGRTAFAVNGWDRIEELPVWTDGDRLDVTNALLADSRLGHERRRFHGLAAKGYRQCMEANHGTNAAIQDFAAWRYFEKYYDIPEGRPWLAAARACFEGQLSTFEIIEDSAGYLLANPRYAMEYALRSHDMRYFTRGLARHKARYIALACLNNVGLTSGFGDSGSLLYPTLLTDLALPAWFDKDPRLYWIIRNRLRPSYGLRIFQRPIAVDLTVAPREPTEWTGLTRIPLYEMPIRCPNGLKKPVYAPKRDLGPDRFNKLIFKENWDPDGQYLLLDGVSPPAPTGPVGHAQEDVNTILNYCDKGRMWLIDHSYPVRTFHRHSGVMVLREGKLMTNGRGLATLRNLVETPRLGVTRTSHGPWTRAIVWRKGRWFAVLDRVHADRSGEYFARATFKAAGEAELRGPDLRLTQKGRFCDIRTDGASRVEVESIPFKIKKSWLAFYPYAKPVAHYFQQQKMRQLKEGQALGFINLLRAYASPKDAETVKLRPLGEQAALVEDRGEFTLIAQGDTEFAPDAEALIATRRSIHALSATALCGGLVRADAPCDLSLDTETRRLTVRCRRVVRLTGPIVGAAKETPPGRHDFAVRDAEVAKATAWLGARLAAARAYAAKTPGGTAAQAATTAEPDGMSAETTRFDAPVNALVLADLDGDGAAEYVTAGPRGARAYRPDGALLWRFHTKRPARAIAVGEALSGTPGPEVAVGCDDEHVYLLDAKGKPRWSFKCKRITSSYAGPAAVKRVWITDLEGDGEADVVVGASWLHVLRPDGRVKWERYMRFARGMISGNFLHGVVGDAGGDGRQEVYAGFLSGYCMCVGYGPDGRITMPHPRPGEKVGPEQRTYGQPIGVPDAMALADIEGGGKTRLITITDPVRVRCLWPDNRRREQPAFTATGVFTKLTVHQPDPARPAAIVCADDMTQLHAFGRWRRVKRGFAWGKLWTRTTGRKISALGCLRVKSIGADAIFVGTARGEVLALKAANGRLCANAKVGGSPVVALLPRPEDGAMLAVLAEGAVAKLRLTASKLWGPEIKARDGGFRKVVVKGKPTYFDRTVTVDTGANAFRFYLRGDAVGMANPHGANFSFPAFMVTVGRTRYFDATNFRRMDHLDPSKEPRFAADLEKATLTTATSDATASVTARLTALAGRESMGLQIKVSPKNDAAPVRVEVLTFPSAMVRKNARKKIAFSSGRIFEARQADAKRPRWTSEAGEFWVYAWDPDHDLGSKRAAGGCGLRWKPEEVKEVSVSSAGDWVRFIFTLPKGRRSLDLDLYDLYRQSNADGLARMGTLGPADTPAR